MNTVSNHFYFNHNFLAFPSSLTFHNMSSMQAAASSAVSWPQTGRDSNILNTVIKLLHYIANITLFQSLIH